MHHSAPVCRSTVCSNPVPRKLLFLDVDGVLNCSTLITSANDESISSSAITPSTIYLSSDDANTSYALDIGCLERLKQLVHSNIGIEIVLTSTWRLLSSSRAHLINTLKTFDIINDLSNISQTSDLQGYATRADEIIHYLKCLTTPQPCTNTSSSLPILSFVILDDQYICAGTSSTIERLLSPHFVHIDEDFGLTSDDVITAQNCLNTSLSNQWWNDLDKFELNISLLIQDNSNSNNSSDDESDQKFLGFSRNDFVKRSN